MPTKRNAHSRAAMRIAFALILALIMPLTVQATVFITDVMVIGNDSKTDFNNLQDSYVNEGWKAINKDLNAGCGDGSDYIHLLYKTTASDGSSGMPITDFYIKSGSNPPADLEYNGRTYYLVACDGSSSFVNSQGDLNRGCGFFSEYIHLYYTKESFPDNVAVTQISFDDNSEETVGWDGNGSAADLNKGCGTNTPYIYMHVETAPPGHKPEASLETCTAGKHQITVSGWAYDPDATAESIGIQVKIFMQDGTTLYKTEKLIANKANANAGVSGNHGFAATFTNIPTATYKLELYALDTDYDGDTQIGATQTVTVNGTQPIGGIDVCMGGAGEITVSGWAYDPDATTESIGVQVKVYESDGTTLYKQANMTADLPHNDVNTTYSITGQHGYSITIYNVAEGTYKVKVFAIDTNGDGDPQIGATQLVSVTKGPVRLTSETGEVTLVDGDVLTGTGGADTHVTIADGATVTLSGVDITSIPNDKSHKWAGINCAGDAVIILADGTTSNLKGGYENYPGIHVPQNKTLTIRGNGTLNASTNDDGWSAGIGGGFLLNCGNIVIDGGTINATGGWDAAAIGGGHDSSCGNITITANVTSVTANKGGFTPGPYSIGPGKDGSCGTVTICDIETGFIEASPFTFTLADIVSVSFDANGGTGTMDSQTFISGFPLSLQGAALTAPDEYRFDGWNTKSDGSGTAYTDGQSITVTTNTTLYAQWKSKVFDLSQIPPATNEVFGIQVIIDFYPDDGDILTGTAGDYVYITIREGFTVTLRNAHIETTFCTEASTRDIYYPGIDFTGSAYLIIEGYNYVKGGLGRPGINNSYSCMHIRGNGVLDVFGDDAINGEVSLDGDFFDIGDYFHRTILSRNLLLPDDGDNGELLGAYNGLTDPNVLIEQNDINVNVTLSGRTLYKDNAWNTLCLPFDVSDFRNTPLQGATVKTLESSSFSNGTLTLNFTDATSIKAGKPYIIKWNGGSNIVNPVFSNVIVNNTTANVETDCVDFIGTYSPTVIYESGDEKHNLFLGDNSTLYYPSAEGFKVNACRAYFRLKNGIMVGDNGSGANAIRSFVLNFGDGDATGIASRPTPDPSRDGGEGNASPLLQEGTGEALFDLTGRRIDGIPTAKGVYVVNGKKIIIK